MAGTTGLEPATSGVTGRHSNQLSYVPEENKIRWWAVTGSNCRPPRCKREALPTELTAPHIKDINNTFYLKTQALFYKQRSGPLNSRSKKRSEGLISLRIALFYNFSKNKKIAL